VNDVPRNSFKEEEKRSVKESEAHLHEEGAKRGGMRDIALNTPETARGKVPIEEGRLSKILSWPARGRSPVSRKFA